MTVTFEYAPNGETIATVTSWRGRRQYIGDWSSWRRHPSGRRAWLMQGWLFDHYERWWWGEE